MERNRVVESAVLGGLLCIGLLLLGGQIGQSLIRFKEFERAVTVKGLSEREVPADIAIWPISFSSAGNELEALYGDLEAKTQLVVQFLTERGFEESEITIGAPAITDKQTYGSYDAAVQLRYTANPTVTVYSTAPERVRSSTRELIELGKSGLALSQGGYNAEIEYLFSSAA